MKKYMALTQEAKVPISYMEAMEMCPENSILEALQAQPKVSLILTAVVPAPMGRLMKRLLASKTAMEKAVQERHNESHFLR